MKVYKATITDKCASPSGEEPASYEGYIAVATLEELKEGKERASRFLPASWYDEDIHFYFNQDEFKPKDGEIETEEFKYLIGEKVAEC